MCVCVRVTARVPYTWYSRAIPFPYRIQSDDPEYIVYDSRLIYTISHYFCYAMINTFSNLQCTLYLRRVYCAKKYKFNITSFMPQHWYQWYPATEIILIVFRENSKTLICVYFVNWNLLNTILVYITVDTCRKYVFIIYPLHKRIVRNSYCVVYCT